MTQTVAPHRRETSFSATSRRPWSLLGLRVAGVAAATALSAFAFPVLGVDVDAAAAQSCYNGCNNWDRDDTHHEIREDRAEVRNDRREIQDDMADIRHDMQSGDYQELQRDIRELHEDRADLHDDLHDLRRDEHDLHQQDSHDSGSSSHHRR